MDHVHDEMVQREGEGSVEIKGGDAGTSAGTLFRNGSNDAIGEEDRMVSDEGGVTKSSF